MGFHIANDNKAQIFLYTCCTIRAVHLDMVLQILKCLFAWRGLPRQFVSDNGKTFKAAAKMIDTIIHHQDVQQYLSRVGVQWHFTLKEVHGGMGCSRKWYEWRSTAWRKLLASPHYHLMSWSQSWLRWKVSFILGASHTQPHMTSSNL